MKVIRLVVIGLAGMAVLLTALPVFALFWRVWRERAWTLVEESPVTDAIKLSLITTSLSLGLILLLGTPLAYALARWRFPGNRLIRVLTQLPIVLPPAVAGLALLVTFGRRGILGPVMRELDIQLVFTRRAVILAQTFVAMPFYVRAALVGFQSVDPDIEDAALVDGASSFWRFVRVTVPLSSRALVSGALLSWSRALGEFGATILFAGSLTGRTQTMPLLIYNIFERDINAAIWTALILVLFAALVMALTVLLSREDKIY